MNQHLMKYTTNEKGHEYIDYNGVYFWKCYNGQWRIRFDGESPIYIEKHSTTAKRLNEFLEKVKGTS